MAIRILFADDHNIVRAAVASYLERKEDIEVVGEVAEGGPVLFDAVATLQPDVLLLDAHMPGHEVDVIHTTRVLCRRYPDLAILIFSAYRNREYVVGLLKAGAIGYVLKGDSPDRLLQAIYAVAEGNEWVSPGVANILVGSVREGEPSPDEVLSPREIEVLYAMARGFTNGRIAEALFISEQTVKNHVSSIFTKLDVSTRVEAVLYAIRHGLSSAEAAASDPGITPEPPLEG